MKVKHLFIFFIIFFSFLLATENQLFLPTNNENFNLWGATSKIDHPNALETLDSLWIKADSIPLPAIGSSDAWTGLKVYDDTIYIVLNQYNLPFQVQKRHRLTGALLSSFNGNTSPSYAMSAVRVDDSIFVSVFYPSPEHIEVYSANGTYVRSFNAPGGLRCRGMDWDGSKFWVANSQISANTIYTMTREGTLLRNLTNTGPVTCYWFFDLTLDRMIPNRLWVNDQESPFVTRYLAVDTNANTFQVNATFNHPGTPAYPEGIGFYQEPAGNGYIYTVGHNSLWAWKMLVHIYTGISDASVNKNLKINNLLKIPLVLKAAEEFSLYDATGKLLITKKNPKEGILIGNGKNNVVTKGIYFIKIKTTKEVITAKAIILR